MLLIEKQTFNVFVDKWLLNSVAATCLEDITEFTVVENWQARRVFILNRSVSCMATVNFSKSLSANLQQDSTWKALRGIL